MLLRAPYARSPSPLIALRRPRIGAERSPPSVQERGQSSQARLAASAADLVRSHAGARQKRFRLRHVAAARTTFGRPTTPKR
jgi:hypothetical protein